MDNQMKFSWTTFTIFRFQSGMPSMNPFVVVGGKKASVTIPFNSITIDDNVSLIYSWTIKNGVILDTILFEDGLKYSSTCNLSKTEQQFFLEQWFTHKGISEWNIFKENSSLFNIESIGFPFERDIRKTIEHKNIIYNNKHLYLGFRGGKECDYMMLNFDFNDNGPKLELVFFNNGIYFFNFIPCKRTNLSFMTYPSETEEQEQKTILEQLKNELSLIVESLTSRIKSEYEYECLYPKEEHSYTLVFSRPVKY